MIEFDVWYNNMSGSLKSKIYYCYLCDKFGGSVMDHLLDPFNETEFRQYCEKHYSILYNWA